MKKDYEDLYDDETVKRHQLFLRRSEEDNEDDYLKIQNRKKRPSGRKINPKAVLIMIAIMAAMALFYVFWQESRPVIDDLLMRIYGAPDSVRQFVVKYPEAKEYIREYRRYKDNHLPADVSGEVKKGTIPLFIQWDPRWGYRTYGSDLMGITGCGPTSLSMVLCGLTGDSKYDPWTVAQWAMDNNYYVDGVGSSWEMMETGAEELGLKVTPLGENIDRMIDELEAGKCVICSVSEGDFTTNGHFIVLTGVDEDGRILLNDSNSRRNTGRAWKLSRLRGQIVSMWAYEENDPALTGDREVRNESVEAESETSTEAVSETKLNK